MNIPAIAIIASILFTVPHAVATTAPDINMMRAGSLPSNVGSTEHFTGMVQINARFQPSKPAHAGSAIVTFAPQARTAWHEHPQGQTLIITSGSGWIQAWGREALKLHPGDVVWIPPHVKHWHGANTSASMTHIAVTEAIDGHTVNWLEKVTDSQYRALDHS